MRILATTSALALSAIATAAGADYTSYHIGNSLTWDSQPEAIAAMSGSRGRTHDVGYHIRCGSSLDQIAADDVTCIAPVADYGVWRNALPAHNFDAITIQPHTGAAATLLGDQTVITQMIDTAIGGANSYADTRFYIYQAWPRLTRLPNDYTTLWNASTANADGTATVYTREYFNHLIGRVRGQRPGAAVGMIPVGEVMAEIDARLKSGELVIPGYSDASDFYREDVHLHMNSLGRFVAASTTYAVMFGEDPTGIASPAGFFNQADTETVFWDSALLTPQVQADLQEVVWDVVQDHPFTSVPEPSSLLIALVGGGLLCTRRRRAS